ncbi:MAG: Omp28-related outer membrane protein, partial [Prevotellaceae bacterium]|nr:Omp28-related outer membrane protein [Prevotellaceae bacterium]
MKSIVISLFLAFVPFGVMADDNTGNIRRPVLVEEFTNTACSPCAAFAPTLDSVLRHRMNDVVPIKYHSNYPSSRDQFYLAARADMDKRMDYYNVTGVPRIIFNGSVGIADKRYVDTQLDIALQAEKKMDMEVNATFIDHVLTVSTDVTPLNDIDNNNLRLFVVAVEEQITLDEPVSNGEEDFYYTARKMLPDADGVSLGTTLEAGKTYSSTVSATLDNFIDENQLGIVCFVQDIETGEVFETIYTPRPTGSDDAAKILSVENTPDKICVPNFYS